MKKLYMQQKVFSFVDKFTIKNEAEEDVYQVEGDFVVVGGKKLHISDMDGNEVALIQQKLLSLMPKFFVFMNEEQVAEINKKFTIFKPKYEIAGPGWVAEGSLMEHDYSIKKGSQEIVKVHKAWVSWGDSYEIDIDDSADTTLALAVVLAIDCVMEMEENAAIAADTLTD